MNAEKSKIYFASDFHLGSPSWKESRAREDIIVHWLRLIKSDAREIFLLGDLFDFWFEYKHVVPKGFIRLLGEIASISDNGTPVHIFTGNHDLWFKDYLTNELSAIIHTGPYSTEFAGKKFYLTHGDGLGPSDRGFKIMKKLFTCRFNRFLFSWLHPDIGVPMANFFSFQSRKQTYKHEDIFLGEKEWLVIHSRDILKNSHFDYLIYGHRHHPVIFNLDEKSIYVNLGDWITHFTFAVFDGNVLELKKFDRY